MSPLFTIDPAAIEQMIYQAMLPFFRIAAFLSVIPLIGSQLVSPTNRMVLAIALSFAIAPSIPPLTSELAFSFNVLLEIAKQILIGIAFGFTLLLFFHIFALAGQLIALQMGLGFASMIDPSNGVSVPIVSQFYSIMVGILFLAINGHLVAIEALAQSFQFIPLQDSWDFSSAAYQLVSAGSWMFSAALLIALPAITAILIVNLSFGVMTRAAPQLNIFSLGFPFTLIFGVFILWVANQGFLSQFNLISSAAFELLYSLFPPAP